MLAYTAAALVVVAATHNGATATPVIAESAMPQSEQQDSPYNVFMPLTCDLCTRSQDSLPFRPTPTPPKPYEPPESVNADCDSERLLDSDGDGVVDVRLWSRYNHAGQLLYFEDGYTQVDWIQEWKYDSRGNTVQKLTDTNGDSEHDYITTYTYAPSGAVLGSIRKRASDGKPVRAESWAYDDEGYLRRSDIDSGADGVPDLWYTYSYSGDGERIERNDFEADRGHVTQLRYVISDSLLVAIQYTPIAAADLIPERRESYRYDDYGNLSALEARRIDTGDVLHGEIYEYYKDTRWVRSIVYHYRLDQVEGSVFFEYDSVGKLVRRLEGDPAAPSSTTEYRYYCGRTRPTRAPPIPD